MSERAWVCAPLRANEFVGVRERGVRGEVEWLLVLCTVHGEKCVQVRASVSREHCISVKRSTHSLAVLSVATHSFTLASCASVTLTRGCGGTGACAALSPVAAATQAHPSVASKSDRWDGILVQMLQRVTIVNNLDAETRYCQQIVRSHVAG